MNDQMVLMVVFAVLLIALIAVSVMYFTKKESLSVMELARQMSGSGGSPPASPSRPSDSSNPMASMMRSGGSPPASPSRSSNSSNPMASMMRSGGSPPASPSRPSDSPDNYFRYNYIPAENGDIESKTESKYAVWKDHFKGTQDAMERKIINIQNNFQGQERKNMINDIQKEYNDKEKKLIEKLGEIAYDSNFDMEFLESQKRRSDTIKSQIYQKKIDRLKYCPSLLTIKNDYSKLKNIYSKLKNNYSQLENNYSQLNYKYSRLQNDYSELENNYSNVKRESTLRAQGWGRSNSCLSQHNIDYVGGIYQSCPIKK